MYVWMEISKKMCTGAEIIVRRFPNAELHAIPTAPQPLSLMIPMTYLVEEAPREPVYRLGHTKDTFRRGRQLNKYRPPFSYHFARNFDMGHLVRPGYIERQPKGARLHTKFGIFR
jgi:hypothetical protein